MKKFTLLVSTVTIAGVFCVVAAFFARYYYNMYWMSVTAIEQTVSDFDVRLGKLEAHKSRELTPVWVEGSISTTDVPLDPTWATGSDRNMQTGASFRTLAFKGGLGIVPALRIPHGSTNEHAFKIEVADPRLREVVVDAWLSQRDHFSDLAAFEEFVVSAETGTNMVDVIVRLKPNVSAKLRFGMVVLCEK